MDRLKIYCIVSLCVTSHALSSESFAQPEIINDQQSEHPQNTIDGTNEFETIAHTLAEEEATTNHQVSAAVLIAYITHTLNQHAPNEPLPEELIELITLFFNTLLEHYNQVDHTQPTVMPCKSERTSAILAHCTAITKHIASIIIAPKNRKNVAQNIANILNAFIAIILEIRKKPLVVVQAPVLIEEALTPELK